MDETFSYAKFCHTDTCGQGARKSGAKATLFRAPLALIVSIDLSASSGEQDEIGVGPKGVPLP